MNKHQYRAALESLKITRLEAAELLDISLRTSQGYALGDYPIPRAIAALLRALVAGKLKPEDVKD